MVELDLRPAALVPTSERRRAGDEADRAFRAALAAVRPPSGKARPTLIRRFDRLWCGYEVEADLRLLPVLKRLPGVRRVEAERYVVGLLDTSVPLIGAAALHQAVPPITGAGVRLAVLDSGVDYNHPDLGGGFGPGFRVELGMDFVDGDGDPMDEHGHGTHTAAVAAGDGTAGGFPWPGVAPGATILAGRVLNQFGTGTQSDLIAGLEWAADPDGDPGTDDGARVILTALGGFGYPDDAVSTAVDTLAATGVLVVAGAGNYGGNGTRYQSILSPGTARGALTVAASDDNDAMTSFSSRGFTGSFLPKPDLTAPGKDICAARWDSWLPAYICEDTTHVETLGTSTAAAHVAGAAALLMEAEPAWSAEEVAAALRETALDLGSDLLVQGSGRIRVDVAAAASAVALPPVLTPGRAPLCGPVWNSEAPFVVRNLGAAAATFDLEVQATLPPGVSAALDVTSVSVPAGGESPVRLQVTVDPSVAPVLDTAPFGHTGEVVVTSPDRPSLRLRVPFWVPASPSLPLSFSFDPLEVYIHNRAGTTWRYVAPGRVLEAALPVGTYDVLAVTPGPQHLVLREGLAVGLCSPTPVSVDLSSAPHAMAITWTDAGGSPLPTIPALCDLVLRHDSGFTYQVLDPIVSILRLPDASSSYRFEWSCADRDAAGDIYLATGSSLGLAGDLAVGTSAGDWMASLVTGLREAGPLWLGASLARPVPSLLPLEASDPQLDGPGPDEPGTERGAWMTPLPYDGFLALSALAFTVGPDPYPPSSVPAALESILVQARDASLDLLLPGTGTATPLASLSSPDPLLTLGLPPYGLAARTRNLPLSLRLYPSRGIEFALFRGQLGTRRPSAGVPPGGIPYSVSQNGSPVDSGVLTHGGQGFSAPLGFFLPQPGPTVLDLTFNAFEVGGSPGTAMATLSMNTDALDPDPPALWRLQVLVDGVPSGEVPACGDTRLRLDFTDDPASLADLEVRVRPTGASSWTTLSPVVSGGGFEVPLVPVTGGGGTVDLLVTASDVAGNRMTYQSVPAWVELPGGTAQDPGTSLRLRRAARHVVLEWTGSPAGPYAVLWNVDVPLGPADKKASVTALDWTHLNAVGDGRRLVYYAVVPDCP